MFMTLEFKKLSILRVHKKEIKDDGIYGKN